MDVALRPDPGAEPAEPVPVTLVAESVADGEPENDAARHRFAAVFPGRISLDLAGDRIWTFTVEADGYWSPRETVFLPAEGESVRMRLWPSGSLSATMVLPRHDRPPDAVRARFRPPPSREGLVEPAGEVACPVEERRFVCRLPAGEHDLRLEFDPFVRIYRFGVDVAADGPTDLGRLELRRGASLVGWVEAEGPGPSSAARVRLEPELGAVVEGEEGERLEGLVRETTLSERGFFRFVGIEPGRYRVVAQDRDSVPARRGGIEIAADSQVELDPPLRLEPPREVEVRLDPPLDPWGERWQVEIDDVSGQPGTVREVAKEVVSPEGRSVFALARGTYVLLIRTGEGDGWHEETFEVGGEARALWVEIPLVRVSGSVRLGREPLAARMAFGGRFASRSIVLASDEEGRYEGILPREGVWNVELVAAEPPVERHFDRIAVSPLPGTDRATVDFELPNTYISGQVVDEMGYPAVPAIVAVSVPEGDEVDVRRFVEDPEGHFEIHGLPSGEALLRAESGQRMSERMPVALIEDLEPPEVRLVVRDNHRVRGRVVTADGRGVPGAALTVRGLSQLHFWVRTTFSQADGSFEAWLPPGESEALVTVTAPGFVLRTFRTPLPADRETELVVSLARGGGAISVSFGEVADGEPPHLDLYLLHQGSFLGYGKLATWAYQLTGSLDPGQPIPQLEPGEYRLCRLSQPELASALFDAPPEGSCDGGFLVENGRLDLKAPPPLAAPSAIAESSGSD